MKLKVAVYNMEWMRNLFNAVGDPLSAGEEGDRSAALARVVKTIDPDILGIVEGPNTLKDESITASEQLEKWAQAHNLNAGYKARCTDIPRGVSRNSAPSTKATR